MEQWVGPIKNPIKVFKEIDDNGGGFILFDEFCDWGFKHGFDFEKVRYK